MTEPSELSGAADTLRAAADLIEEHGWSRGSGITPEGHLCALGAIQVASGVFSYDFERNVITSTNHSALTTLRSQEAIAQLAELLPPAPISHVRNALTISHYNDANCPDQDTIVQALRSAAHRAEAVQRPSTKDTVSP